MWRKRQTGLAARFPAEPAAWDRVGHLWDCGRAPERPDHPDHKLAQVLLKGFLASLPSIEPRTLERLVSRGLQGASLGDLPGSAEFPRTPEIASDLGSLLATDQLRAAFGRIACMYDGGHLAE